MKTIKRQFVTTLIDRFKEQMPLIQIIMGPRQVGKTTGVLQFLDMYSKPYHYTSADDIISGDRSWILQQWQKAQLKGSDALLVIDEIQKIDGWSETIKNLWDEQKVLKTKIKVLLLGSSSLALSKGVSESLAGRFELISVYHWDYAESLSLCEMGLETFLESGGYPQSYSYLDDYDRWFSYLKDAVVDRVIDKDILQFAIVKKPALFRQAFEIVCCYPSLEISYTKLLGQLQNKGNTDLIKYYLSLLEGAFLIKTLQKYGTQDFKTKSSSPKIVPLAPCFYQLFANNNDKADFVFEATVGTKLLQVSKELYYWRKGNYEVDFVLRWQKKIYAVEVKSGKTRRASGLELFCQQFVGSIPIIVSKDNYLEFISDPQSFLRSLR
ncbi:MAG: ATP-binding protein [Bacteriovoracaceae bacterium]|nr:ATP-binding protein [Bacteriovoracaceae bacterium]